MTRFVIVAALAAALAACSNPQAEAERALRVDAIAALQQATGDRPDTHVIWAAVSPNAPTPTVCGEANVATQFGGVSRARRFMYLDRQLVLFDAETPPARVYEFGRWCRIAAR